MKLIDLSYQNSMIMDDVKNKVCNIIESGNYIGGEEVLLFEKEIEEYIGVKHAISVANGTDALIIALQSLDIGEGDEVITTPFTYYATAESIKRVGAKVVFCDVDEETFNINPDLIEALITPNTKAILPVHIFGNPCDMDKINKIAKAHGLFVIEDACQAIGSSYNGSMIGSLADVGCISFFPTKNLGGMGDGGMIVTNNDEIAIKAIALKNHGSGNEGRRAYELLKSNDDDYKLIPGFEKYYNYIIGYNSRLDAIQAGILRVKLPFLDKWNNSRIEAAKIYKENIRGNYQFQATIEGAKHIYHLFTIRTNNREGVLELLKQNNVGTGVYYPVPLHLQKVFEDLGYKRGSLEVAEKLCEEVISLPMYPGINEEDVIKVARVLSN